MLAVVYCLRVGDLESICWAYISSPQFFTFWDEKCNCRLTRFPLSPYLETWREHVCTLRLPHHHDYTSVFPGGRKSLRFYLGELLRDTDSAGLQWHCHKRMGATAFMAQGGSTRGLQMWARWRSPQMARHYAAHPPTWRLPPTLHLPLPERPGPGRAYTRVRINTRDLWPKQAFKDNPRPYAPPPAHVEVTRPEPASGDHGDDSDTDTNEDPRTSKVPPPWTPSHPSGQPHSHRSPRQPSPSLPTPNQLRPSDQHPPPPGPARRAANCRGSTAQCTPAARPRGTPRNLQQRGGQQNQRCCGNVYPPLVYPTPPQPEPAPPPSTIPRGCGLHANSTHEPTPLARADLRRRVPTPSPCRRGHTRVRGSWTSTAWQDMAQHGSQEPNTAGIRSSIPHHRQSSDHKKSEHRPSHLRDISNRAGRPQCSHAGQTQTHTMGTWSRRLGKGIDSENCTHCRCGSPNPAIEHLTPPPHEVGGPGVGGSGESGGQ